MLKTDLDIAANTHKCPNCDEDSLIFWNCSNCWCNTRSSWADLNISSKLYNLFDEAKEDSESKDEAFKLKLWNHESYKITIKNWRIKNILFKIPHWKTRGWNVKYNKFRIFIDYILVDKVVDNFVYHEPDPEDRHVRSQIKKAEKLKIGWINKKEKVWYWPFYSNVNYFGYCWIEFTQLKKFVEVLVKKYHNKF